MEEVTLKWSSCDNNIACATWFNARHLSAENTLSEGGSYHGDNQPKIIWLPKSDQINVWVIIDREKRVFPSTKSQSVSIRRSASLLGPSGPLPNNDLDPEKNCLAFLGGAGSPRPRRPFYAW